MGLIKKNVVKCDLASYIHYWRGVKKSGKTTLFYKLLLEKYGSLDKGVLLSIGNEIGYQALDGLNYVECPDWATLVEAIDDLIDNKAEYGMDLICFDTVDEWVTIAKEEVKRLHKKAKGAAAEFNACFGGYGAPREKVVELIDEQLTRVRRAGYGIIYIGHTKIRDIKEKNGDDYQQLTSNLSADYDGIFANKADIVMTIAIEKNIDEAKHISGTKRFMYFRSDGFVDAGGRFSDMPERVEYGADNYIKAFEEGVKGAIVGDVTDKDIQKRVKAEQKERKAKADEYIEKEKETHIDIERNQELRSVIQDGFSSLESENKQIFKDKMAELGVKSFKNVDDIPTKSLETLVELLNTF